MNNSDVQRVLDECWLDINQVSSIINSLGITSNINPYLTKYAIIRACGTIEIAYKTLIADYCCRRSKSEVKNYINKFIRESSSNPSYDNILRTLSHFNSIWVNELSSAIDVHPRTPLLCTSLQSLVDARNDFAHGGNPSTSINNILINFEDSCMIIDLLDQIIG